MVYVNRHVLFTKANHSRTPVKTPSFIPGLPAKPHMTIVIELIVAASFPKSHMAVIIKAFSFRTDFLVSIH